MFELKRLLIVAGCTLLIGACTTDLQKAERTSPSGGTEFTRAQSATYREMAINQWTGQYDFTGSEHFARKSLAAGRGEAVAPDVPGASGFRPVKLHNDLTSARERLVRVLENNATTRNPALAARAQGAFDCWLDEAADPIFAVEGPWLDDKVQNCRRDFESHMAELERAPASAQTAPAAPAPAPAARVPEQSSLVFFDWDRSDITPEAATVIRRAAETARNSGATRIEVVGHADRSGPDAYNMGLSQRRANAVRAVLVREGVPQNRITTAARGETQPLVPTPDGVREPQNRRAEINLR